MRPLIAFALLVGGCGASHAADDGGVESDAGTMVVADAGLIDERDAGRTLDGGGLETDAGRETDAGMEPGPDAGGGERTGFIECGATPCDRATHGCLASCQRDDAFEPACVPVRDDGTWPAEECPSGDEQFPRYWLTCDGPEDCPGVEGCHMIFGSLGQYANCGLGSDRLCHDDADCPADAPRCAPTDGLPGYSACTSG